MDRAKDTWGAPKLRAFTLHVLTQPSVSSHRPSHTRQTPLLLGLSHSGKVIPPKIPRLLLLPSNHEASAGLRARI